MNRFKLEQCIRHATHRFGHMPLWLLQCEGNVCTGCLYGSWRRWWWDFWLSAVCEYVDCVRWCFGNEHSTKMHVEKARHRVDDEPSLRCEVMLRARECSESYEKKADSEQVLCFCFSSDAIRQSTHRLLGRLDANTHAPSHSQLNACTWVLSACYDLNPIGVSGGTTAAVAIVTAAAAISPYTRQRRACLYPTPTICTWWCKIQMENHTQTFCLAALAYGVFHFFIIKMYLNVKIHCVKIVVINSEEKKNSNKWIIKCTHRCRRSTVTLTVGWMNHTRALADIHTISLIHRCEPKCQKSE